MCASRNNRAECNCKDEPMSKERRKFLGGLIGLFNAVVGIAVLGPVIGFIGAPLAKKLKGEWVPVLDDADLAVGETREANYSMVIKDGYRTINRSYNVFLHRHDDRIAAFNPSCTHLGCRIEFQDDKGRYFCPCHGGVFDERGEVVAGPPPRALDQYETKVEDGKVWIYREV
ncbi:MAG: ubiquinol-cytochrome c reductase iron-sulfur subunit [Armatimonadetes bacterium]|nr:ubiquinol-cytochrome c reductase iron-sulfur subunit [Armatimonadota bacterium]